MLDKDLRGLPVVTKKGDKVGKVTGLVVDVDQHTVVQYVVAKSSLLSAIMPGELLIHPSQVVSIDESMMVIKDAAVAEEAAAKLRVREAAGTSTTASRAE